MNVEHQRHISSREIKGRNQDPLSEQKKKAERISRNLELLGVSLDIRILGAYHMGQIGQDIKDAIYESNIVTLELPSQVVTRAGKGEKGHILSQNKFWADILDLCTEHDKRVFGVNNNRSSVNGLRLLGSRMREGQRPFDGGPDLVISARTLNTVIRNFVVGAAIQDSPSGEPFIAILTDNITVRDKVENLQRVDPDFPVNTLAPETEGLPGEPPTYLHYLKPLPVNGARALICTGDWASPMEFVTANYSELMEGHEDIFPNVYGIVDYGAQHLMRLRGDRTQVDGMISAVDKELKRQIREGKAESIELTHVGGAAHDKNLIGIMGELFKGSGCVRFVEKTDQRILPLPTDPFTFFDAFVPVNKGLLSTKIFHDQILINIPSAFSVIRESISSGKEELSSVWKREELINRYFRVRNSVDEGEIDILAAKYLLSLLPKSLLEEEHLPDIDEGWVLKLAEFVSANFPDRSGDVKRVLVVVNERGINFPQKIQ